jgi:hypothetical protein
MEEETLKYVWKTMPEIPTYSYTEIQRYLQQKMSPQEMHEFEKALINDPFLADAMEGFSATDTARAQQHLMEIVLALAGNQQQAKVVPLPAKTTAWWKVAAIILVIICCGAITYSVVNNSNASKDKHQVAASASSTITSKKDSLRSAGQSLTTIDPLREKKFLATKKKSPQIIQTGADKFTHREMEVTINAGKAGKTNAAIASLTPASATAHPANAATEMMTLQRASPQNQFKGTVVDKFREPLPFAALKSNTSNAATVADSNGNFNLKASDSVVDVTVVSPGYPPKVAKLSSNKSDNKISLGEDELTLSEMVVTDQLKKKNKVAPVQFDTSVAAEPAGGWNNFKQYLIRQIDSLKTTELFEGVTKSIILEFSIDKNGQPVNIKTSPEINRAIAEKAAQILTNGPRWNNKTKEEKVKVIISF